MCVTVMNVNPQSVQLFRQQAVTLRIHRSIAGHNSYNLFILPNILTK